MVVCSTVESMLRASRGTGGVRPIGAVQDAQEAGKGECPPEAGPGSVMG